MLAYIVALVEIRDFQYHCDNARDDGKYYYYVKYIDTLSDHTEIEGKTIYLADYKFNKTEADTEGYYPRMDIYQDLISNVFKFINLYNIDETKIPKG